MPTLKPLTATWNMHCYDEQKCFYQYREIHVHGPWVNIFGTTVRHMCNKCAILLWSYFLYCLAVGTLIKH